jgi:HD-GYP domain-containing protein (c-di-GMP phosphodiesterase class II)
MLVFAFIEQFDVLEMMAFSLESRLDGLEVLGAHRISGVMTRISDPQFLPDLLICDATPEGKLVLEAIFKKFPVIPTVLVGGGLKADPLLEGKNIVATIDPKETLETQIIPIVKANFKLTNVPVNESDYVRINTTLLLRVAPLKSDIYVRLSQEKFVKIMRQGDTFDSTDLEKYKNKKKIEHMFLKKSETKEFLNKFSGDLMKLLKSPATELSTAKMKELSIEVYETTQGMIEQLGPTPEIQEIIKSSVELAIKSAGTQPGVQSLFADLLKDRHKYIASHSHLLGTLACTLATLLKWDSESTFYKLSLAAFLHDIMLKNQKLAEIQSLQELATTTGFSVAEEIAFKTHPIDAAHITKEFQDVPADVDSIVAQHHELPDGSGFPKGIVNKRKCKIEA